MDLLELVQRPFEERVDLVDFFVGIIRQRFLDLFCHFMDLFHDGKHQALAIRPDDFDLVPSILRTGLFGKPVLLSVNRERTAFPCLIHKAAQTVEEVLQFRSEFFPFGGDFLRDGAQFFIAVVGQLGLQCGEEPAGIAAVERTDILQHAVDVKQGRAEAQRTGSGGFEVVAFIDDEIFVIRNHAFRVNRIRQQQRVIDDDDVRVQCLGADGVERTLVLFAEGTEIGTAALIFCREASPDFSLDGSINIQVAAVAGSVFTETDQHLSQHPHLFRCGCLTLLHGGKPAGTKIVASSFLHSSTQFGLEDFFQRGNILVDKLILKVDGVGRDDHTLSVLHRPLEGGDQVSEGFPGAGAGFDERVMPFGKGVADGLQHFDLLLPRFEAFIVPAESAALGKDLAEFFTVQRFGIFCRFEFELFPVPFRREDGQLEAFVIVEALSGLHTGGVDLTQRAEPVPLGGTGDVDECGEQLEGQAICLFDEFVIKLHRHGAVCQSPVLSLRVDVELLCEGGKLVASGSWQEHARQFVRIGGAVLHQDLIAVKETKVKADIVPDNSVGADELSHFIQNIEDMRCFGDHGIGDMCQLGDRGRNRTVGIDKGLVGLQDFCTIKADHADFDDLILPDVQPRGFQIQCNHAHKFSILSVSIIANASLIIIRVKTTFPKTALFIRSTGPVRYFLKKIKYNKTRITAAISRIAENFPPEAPLEAGRSGSGSGSRRGMFGTALTRIVSSA